VHIRLLAVGDRQPSWVDSGFESYAVRLPQQWRFRADTIAVADRRRAKDPTDAIRAEGDRLLAKLKPAERVVLLDEQGRQFTSRELAGLLEDWQSGGDDLAFVIGGPDGVSDAIRERAALTWSLSTLTLPHGLARILFVEQLYRAWSLSAGHPYHRD